MLLNNQQRHYISQEVINFFICDLGLNVSELTIPDNFDPNVFDGSHLNWNKEKNKFCYIRKHNLNLYDLDNFDDLYEAHIHLVLV